MGQGPRERLLTTCLPLCKKISQLELQEQELHFRLAEVIPHEKEMVRCQTLSAAE